MSLEQALNDNTAAITTLTEMMKSAKIAVKDVQSQAHTPASIPAAEPAIDKKAAAKAEKEAKAKAEAEAAAAAEAEANAKALADEDDGLGDLGEPPVQHSQADVAAVLGTLVKAARREEAKTILADFGYASLKEIEPKNYNAIFDRATALISK